jgi:hypothetical protein
MKFENKKCINYDFIFKKNCDEKMKWASEKRIKISMNDPKHEYNFILEMFNKSTPSVIISENSIFIL